MSDRHRRRASPRKPTIPVVSCDRTITLTAFALFQVHHSAGGALLTYVRTPTADWVAPAATLVCGPTNVHSGVTSVWVDHWIAGAPVSQ